MYRIVGRRQSIGVFSLISNLPESRILRKVYSIAAFSIGEPSSLFHLYIVLNRTDVDRKEIMISESQRRALQRYRQSPKGKEAVRRAQRRYEKTRKAKARRKKYADSLKGKEAMAKCRDRANILK
jgi:hypothetical protein